MARQFLRMLVTPAICHFEAGFVGVCVITKKYSDGYSEGWSIKAGPVHEHLAPAQDDARASCARVREQNFLETPDEVEDPPINWEALAERPPN